MGPLPSLSPLDWGLLAVLGLSVIVGLRRGIVFELMSLAGWVLAWGVAQAYGGSLAPWLPMHAGGPALRGVTAFGLTFVGTLALCAVLARIARALISATPLSVVDRMLGAGFGLARGLVVLLVVATVVAWTPASTSPVWRSSQGATWLGQMVDGLRPLWPDTWMRIERSA